MDKNRAEVVRNELIFLIENPEYLDDVTDYLVKLTPEMVSEKIKFEQWADS